MSDASEAERKTKRCAWLKEYEQRDYRKEKSRVESRERCRQKKLLSTAARFEEHSFDELLIIAMLRCQELGIDYKENENVIMTTMKLLHGSKND